MTKSELVYEVCKKLKLPAADVERIINAATAVIKAELVQGGKVKLLGFGTFEVRDRAPRKGVNPRTQEPIDLPATKRVHFSPGKALKKSVNA